MDRPRIGGSAGIDLANRPTLRVGAATIDPISREATFPGGTERLQPQILKVLIALHERTDQVVTRNELIDRCWDGRIVGEDVINHAISVLRTFAQRSGGFTIETVPKAGYRLIDRAPSGARWKPWAVIGAGLAVAAVCLLAWTLTDHSRSARSDPPGPRIALLPLSVPPNDPSASELARQVHSDLTHMMTQSGIPPLISANQADLRVGGDVKRRQGWVDLTVRVDDGRTGEVLLTHDWSVAAADSSGLAEQVGAFVAANLSGTAVQMIVDQSADTDSRLNAQLLRQQAIVVSGGDNLAAYQMVRETTDRLPNSVIAQFGLAMNSAFALSQLPPEDAAGVIRRARAAAAKAKQLAPRFGDVYAADCVLAPQVRYAACEAVLRNAARIDPDATFVNTFLSSQMMDTGRFLEALDFARLSIATDPYKPGKLYRMIALLDNAKANDEAVRYRADADRWWPGNPSIIAGKMDAFFITGNFGGMRGRPDLTFEQAPQFDALVTAWQAKDRKSAEKVCGQADTQRATDLICILILPQLGSFDLAFRIADPVFPKIVGRTPQEEDRLWLQSRGYVPVSLLSMPSAAALRTDPRFLELAGRTGLLTYWRTVALPDFCTRKREQICDRIKPQV